MAFTPEPNRIQTSIGDISYQFFDPNPDGGEQRAAEFSAQILDQDGQVLRVREDEMIQHMLPEEIQTILGLLAAWRERAQGLIPQV